MNPPPAGRHFTHKPLMSKKPLLTKGFLSRLLRFSAPWRAMIDVAKFPYLTSRKGSSNLYYKREVPP
jgi:hypothetical protein